MSFSFNFDLPDESGNSSMEPAENNSNVAKANEGKTGFDISHPFVWKGNLESLLDDRAQKEIIFTEIKLEEDGTTKMNDDESQQHPLRQVCIDQYKKDVTPGVYEGGLQVWECSLDLVRYFRDNNLRLLKGSAMELGCGHALPGCWVLREALLSRQNQKEQDDSSIQVVFVDYNDYVIDDVTLSNVVLNTAGIVEAKTLAQKQQVQLGSGCWMDMSSNHLQDRRFDWILAAETTYTPEAAKDTAQLLLQHLTVDTGIGWIACKRYYFGTGGGTGALREAAQTLSQSADVEHYLKVETVRVLDNGAGNIREVVKVTCHLKDS